MNSALKYENWKQVIVQDSACMADAINCLNSNESQIVLVTNDQHILVGTITDGDIRRSLLGGATLETPVIDLMNKNPLFCSESMDNTKSAELMISSGVNQLPVLDENRQIVGLRIRLGFHASTARPNLMVIMAGGEGRRLRPLTNACPKPMLKIGGKPMLQIIIEKAISLGMTRFIISINYLGDMIKTYFQDGSWLGVSIDYIEETKPLGTAGALALIESIENFPLVIINGDVVTDVDYGELIDFHIAHNSTATMAVRNHIIVNPFGVVKVSGLDIVGIEEKPSYSSFVNGGLYILNPQAIALIKKGNVVDMPDFFSLLSREGHRCIAFPMHEEWLDVGGVDDLALARSKASRIEVS